MPNRLDANPWPRLSLLPDHRNLWKEPAAAILDPKGLHQPPDRSPGGHVSLRRSTQPPNRERGPLLGHGPDFARWYRPLIWRRVVPARSAPCPESPCILSWNWLVRLGLTPREALAAATSNYSEQFGWHELGLVEAGRRADLLILAADPTTDISNTRKIHSVVLTEQSSTVLRCSTAPGDANRSEV